jgi:maltodextrin utilization protein YvdJ
MSSKIGLMRLFRAGVYRFSDAFAIHHISLFKAFLYFVLINLMMLMPVSLQIMNLSDFDFERFGMNFTSTEIPEWIPDELPAGCIINFNELDCGHDLVYTYYLENNGTMYTILFNVDNDTVIETDNTIIFYQNWIDMRVRGSVVRLTYEGFNGMVFDSVMEENPEDAAAIIFEAFFQSVKRVFVLPLMLFVVGALFIMNLILITLLAALSMLFKFNQSNFPSYPNMIKLFMIASTIPALINVLLGFLGLSAFTSITYNFITPVIALLMYRASRQKLEVIETFNIK